MTADDVRGWSRYLDTSPLYRELTRVIASDADLIRVLNQIEHTPRPNVLLAGVQFLMMRGGGGQLARHYPNFPGDPVPSRLGSDFREFVLANEPDLVEIGRTRYTQTNECRRCVVLLAAIWETPATRFHLIDVGASAGLNLLMDRYHYRIGDFEWGQDSTVILSTDLRGRAPDARGIEILSKTGLDLHPVDPTNPEDARWLEALVWPENQERRLRLRAALALAEADTPHVVGGGALETLPGVLDALPRGDAAVVMNSFILNQLPRGDRETLVSVIAEEKSRRPIYRVSYEWLDENDPGASIEIDEGAGLRRIGIAHPHGEWMELYARP